MSRLCSLTLCSAALLLAGMNGIITMAQSSSSLRYDVMPQPRLMQQAAGSFAITPGLAVRLQGTTSPRITAGVLRAMKRMEDKTGLPLARSVAAGGSAAAISVSVTSDGGAIQGIEEDESYTLRVSSAGVRIEAPTTVGALHAFETLIQLTQPSGDHYILPAVEIQDSPRFAWRGLMIDCSRHFEPISVLERNIDAMAAVKLNVFHWHLIDDQGFRMESKVYPKLTELGSDGSFYTQAEARDLVAYARARGIRVVPEFEMPGHSTAWLVAYPEMASGSNPDGIRRQFGISNYAIDPTREETFTFIESFLREMTAIFPDKYVHIGGDEAPAVDWKTNPRILAFKKVHNLADNDALQAYFNQRVLAILTKLDRRMVGWDEIFNPALPKDVVVQSWRGEASLAKGAQAGYQGILSAPYYLDAMKPAGMMYLADPVPANTALTSEQQKLILGGEITMWAEQYDQHTIDSRIWPRAAAIAERFWSRQDVIDVDNMYSRLWPVSLELETLGLQHISSEAAGLRDLAGTEDIRDLLTFSKALEPVSFSDRYKEQRTSQLTPLTNYVDAVVPDPPTKHEVEAAAKALIAAPGGRSAHALLKPGSTSASDTLNNFFNTVKRSIPGVRRQMTNSPRLLQVSLRTDQLERLCTIGIEATGYLSTDNKAPAGWKQHALHEIAEAKKPSAVVRFTFLNALTDLVNATK